LRRLRALACVVLLVGCSSSRATTNSTVLPLGDLPGAVAAVQAVIPGAKFTEINVSPAGVTLFAVPLPGQERSYLYLAGKLGEPGPDAPSLGEAFALEGISLDQGAKSAAFVAHQFEGAEVTSVALVRVKPNGLVWAIRSRSVKGGLLNNLFSPDGHLISAFPTGS
jgi:hypothetical protein